MVLEIQPAFHGSSDSVFYGTGFCLESIFSKCISVVTQLSSDEVDGGKFGILMKG